MSKVLVTPAQVVKAGEPLIQLDEKALQATLEERQGELDRNVGHVTGGRAYLDHLQKNLASGGDAAKKKYEDSRNWLAKIEAKTPQLRARVEDAKRQLKESAVRAPADGHIAKVMVSPGVAVVSGQPLVEFVGVEQPRVIADFKVSQLERMRIGQKVTIDVKGIDRTFIGTLESMPESHEIPSPKTAFERLLDTLTKKQPRVPLRIAFDPESLEPDVNRLIPDAPAQVKVYIKK